MGGFDTLKKQVNASYTTTGSHAKLKKDPSSAIAAFQKNALGQVIKVITSQPGDSGTYNIDIYNDGLMPRPYFLRLQNKAFQKVISIMKMK